MSCSGCGVDLLSQPVALVTAEVASEDGRGPSRVVGGSKPRVRARRSRWLGLGAVLAVAVAATQWAIGSPTPPSARRTGAAPASTVVTVRLRAVRGLTNAWLIGTAPPARPTDAPQRVPLLVDLSTGRARLAFGVPDARQDAVLVRGSALVVPAVVGTLVVERPASARPVVRRVAAPFVDLFVSWRPDSFWGVTDCAITTGGGPRVTCRAGVTELGTDGVVRTERLLPSGWSVVAGGLDDDLLMLSSYGAGRSRFALWDARTGAFRSDVAPPRGMSAQPVVLAVAGHHIVWRAMECSTTCPAVLADLRTGAQRVLGATAGIGASTEPAARFSPDGGSVAVATRRFVDGRSTPVDGITVFDAQTAAAVWTADSTTTAGNAGRPARGSGVGSSVVWDPSGRWLFFTVDSRLFAHRIGAHDDVALGAFAPSAAFDRAMTG